MPPTKWVAFQNERCLASGAPVDVARAVRAAVEERETPPILIFEDETGKRVDLDLSGSVDDVIARLSTNEENSQQAASIRGPGRPKLGVVAREVTLLPRHWEWLANQPGGASVALRKLVDAARSANAPEDRKRRACESADRFMLAVAGDLPGYEEAARALYRGEGLKFDDIIATWPPDIRDHVRHLAHPAFESAADKI
jgi:hypothetical protein